uniref:Uncharacterized protein n=1 Tax=Rhizophora mucronata TaxID=61149 RepID=A0A2P2QDT4_RHIMU
MITHKIYGKSTITEFIFHSLFRKLKPQAGQNINCCIAVEFQAKKGTSNFQKRAKKRWSHVVTFICRNETRFLKWFSCHTNTITVISFLVLNQATRISLIETQL